MKNITHRDLKLKNLLLDSIFNLKVIDFGFSTSIQGKKGNGLLRTKIGTINYMAPEIHANFEYMGKSVDLFACGVILF